MVIGPLGGGLLVDHASWRWIFGINVPFVLATLALVRAAVPESVDEESTHRIDYLGALLVALGLAGPVFALIEQPVYGFGDPIVYLPGLIGAALLVAVRPPRAPLGPPDAAAVDLPLAQLRGRQRRDAARLRRPVGAATFFVAIYLQQVAGYTAVAAGLTLLPITVIMFVLSRRWGALSDRIGPRALMGAGPIVGGLGLVWMGRLDADVDYVTDLLPGRAPVRARAVDDGGAADQHGARRGAAAQRGRGQRRQQRDLARRRACSRSRRSARWWRRSSARRSTSELAGRALSAAQRGGRARGQGAPAVGRRARASRSSTRRSRRPPCTPTAWGMGVGGGLMMLGGVISLVGIVNPARRREPQRPRDPRRAELVYPCPERRREAEAALGGLAFAR